MHFYFELPEWITDKRTRTRLVWYLLFFVNLIVIGFVWTKGSSSYYLQNPDDGNAYIALGRLTGLLVQLAITIQLLLVSRMVAIEQSFGFDRLNRVHRLVGKWLLVGIVLHPILLSVGYAVGNATTPLDQFFNFLATWENVFLAFVGSMLFVYVALISYAIVRKRLKYELWYYLHLLTYVAFGLVFLHELESGDLTKDLSLFYWYFLNFTVIAFVIAYRVIRPLWKSARHGFTIAQVTVESKDTFSVYITGRDIVNFGYKSGQYANLTFLQKGMWFTHPFSFSAEHNDTYIRFTMKALGDYTKRLGELRPGTRVIIDGPLGLFIEEKAKNEKLLFIAGGIGITPIRSMIGDIVRRGKDITLIYAVRTLEDIAFRKEFESLRERQPFPIHYIVSTPTPGYETGFLDREKLVRLVPDFYERDVYLCGPPPMMDATIVNLKGLGFKEENLHYEKFSF